MESLILLTVAALPFYTVGRFAVGSFVSLPQVLLLLLVLYSVSAWLGADHRFKKAQLRWLGPFLAFLVVGVMGLLLSPYGSRPWPKGGIQVLGIVAVLVMGTAIVKEIGRRPLLLFGIARVASVSLGLFALVGIVQFLAVNFTPYGGDFGFSFLNDLAGGGVWRSGGRIGHLERATSFAREPSHFAIYLGFGLGLALIRLGLTGRTLRRASAPIVPLWAAVAIVTGVLISISILGWLLLGLVVVTLVLLLVGLRSRQFVWGVVAIVACVGVLFSMKSWSGRMFDGKLSTLSLVANATKLDLKQIRINQLSALALSSNTVVALRNLHSDPLLGGGLGSHPLAYDRYAPAYVNLSGLLKGLNKEDAASLLLRLLSETGVLGATLFIGGILWPLVKARRAIVTWKKLGCLDAYTAVASGFTAACAGVFAICLARMGLYYDPILWIPISLVVAVPQLPSVTGRSPERRMSRARRTHPLPSGLNVSAESGT